MVVRRREVWTDVTWSYFVAGEVDFAKLLNAEHIREVVAVTNSSTQSRTTTAKKMRINKF
jgi:hypothetical protein